MRVSAGSAVKYATLPGIFPRIRDLFFTGFGPVTYLVASICAMLGLVPRTHPCFFKKTRDQYKLHHILAIAANNLDFKWKNIDQIIIFGVLLCGTVMLMTYIVGAILFVLVSPASALGFLIPEILVTQAPQKDVAFMMLDRVFGLPDVFNSCISTGAPCYTVPDTRQVADPLPFPNAFQIALQELFAFFSMGIFFIALVIFLYHIVQIVFDITQTGKVADTMSDDVMEPYADGPSKGFTWLPIRFLVCFGLLLPFGEGLNSAQWIVLYTAKYGSGLATNAWIQYNTTIGENPTGEVNTSLVSRPSQLDTSDLIKSLLVLRGCMGANYQGFSADADGAYNVIPYIIGQNGGGADGDSFPLYTTPYIDNPNGFMASPTAGFGRVDNSTAAGIANGSTGDPFINIWNFSGNGDIQIVIGVKSSGHYDKYPGKVLPVCGQVTIPVTGRTGEGLFAAEGYFFAVIHVLFDSVRPGVELSDEEVNSFLATSREYSRISSSVRTYMRLAGIQRQHDCLWYDQDDDGYETLRGDGRDIGYCKDSVPSEYWNTLINQYYKPLFATPPLSAYDFLAGTATASATYPQYAIGGTAWNALGKDNPFLMTTGIKDYGWGGAGLWYNKISERNGSLYTATTSLPVVQKYPMIMEDIRNTRQKTDTSSGALFCENYNPQKAGTTSSYNPTEKNQFSAEQAKALYLLCTQLFHNENLEFGGVSRVSSNNNPVEAAIASIFTEFKSYDILKNYDVTPMAQLSSMGRMMIDKSILGIIGAGASAAAGGALHMMAAENPNKQVSAMGDFAGALSGIILNFAILGLTGGVMMHYVLPFMPFVYFFFAVGRWVKVIFEAMVGVPLWALAHMRVGGPGLPGDAASSGYFLILEIFMRPIVTVFSLVGAFAIFSALAVGLNAVFTLAATNLFGSPPANADLYDAFQNGNIVELGRGMVDQFFITIFYILIMYVIGTGSFKLIDLIPDNLMRWSGAGVQGMGAADISDDLLETFEKELPYRFESMAQTAGGVFKEVLYNPAKEADDKANAVLENAARQKTAAEKAQKEAEKEREEANKAMAEAQAHPDDKKLQEKAAKEEREAKAAEDALKERKGEANKAMKEVEDKHFTSGISNKDRVNDKVKELAEEDAKAAQKAKQTGSWLQKLFGLGGK